MFCVKSWSNDICFQIMDSALLTSTILLLLFNFVFFWAGLFLNCVVIISIWRSCRLRKKFCYFAIFLLSCADLSVVVLAHPFLEWVAISKLLLGSYQVKEIIFRRVIFLGQSLSVLLLLTLNVERFLAIKFPFFHQNKVTKKRLVGFTAILESLILLLESLASFSIIPGMMFLCLPLIVIILVYLNFEMYKIAKSKERRTPCTITTENVRKRKHHKTLPTFVLVVCLMVFTLPTTAWLAYKTHLSRHPLLFNINEVHLSLWSQTTIAMNSTLNCLVFFWKNSILRREGLKIVKKLNFCER